MPRTRSASPQNFAILFAVLSAVALAPLAVSAQQNSLPCARSSISAIAMPTGPARFAAGKMTLANKATLELAGILKSPEMYRVSQMRVGDRVVACHGRVTTYADAGPSSTITLIDLRNGGYYGTLIGNW